MHVRFTEDFDWVPPEAPRTCIAYKAGWSGSVRNQCGQDAITAKKAVKVPTPRRDDAKA